MPAVAIRCASLVLFSGVFFSGAVVVASIDTAVAEPLKLEAGKPLEIVCDTKAFLVATNAANATSGEVRLKLEIKKLEIKDAAAKPQPGTPLSGIWTPVSTGDSHKASFAASQKQACASGCPLMVSAEGQAQLWAPAAKGMDKLAETELLVLAVIRPEKFDIKVSTFRGQSIEALEEGTCRSDP